MKVIMDCLRAMLTMENEKEKFEFIEITDETPDLLKGANGDNDNNVFC